jgi:PAS domain S-box-containing protein
MDFDAIKRIKEDFAQLQAHFHEVDGVPPAVRSHVQELLDRLVGDWLRIFEDLQQENAVIREGAKKHEIDTHVYREAQSQIQTYAEELAAANEELRLTNEELSQINQELTRRNAELASTRKKAEQERQRYYDLFDAAPEGYLVTDHAGRILEANAAVATMLALHKDSLAGRNLVHFFADGSKGDFQNLLFEAVRGKNQQDCELQVQPFRKGPVTVSINVSSAYAEDSAVRSLRWMLRDITERTQVDEAIRQSEAKYRSLVDDDISADFICTRDGRILDCNPAFARMFGFASVAEAESANILVTYIHPEERAELIDRLQQETRLENVERFRKRQDGTQIHVVENIIGIFDAAGNLVVTKGYIIEDTERLKAEEAMKQYAEHLKRSNEDLERFAYVSSHDLQEPLRTIVTFTQLLERKYVGRIDPEADEYIRYIVDAGRRMQDLIHDLLEYSRITSKAQELQPVRTEEVLAQALLSLNPIIKEESATITYDLLPVVQADPQQLRQVFQNLISNALKYRREDEPPRIRISAERTGDMWQFNIQDNGLGIEPQYFDRIFVIFQRLHTRDQYVGTGIGLAIVKRIVERQGGRIWVESEVDRGSTFHFTIPAVNEL